ncbi:hypothetical protein PIB30_031685 [Stylosanthes scabra]|uniref:RRM domain-containing protein n=1 Tax=Stylosanthes scabra TaxID=79078 RepID=A0ABU6QC51_9FABA|nr:hypothetical protein [Stylosanthes scabra]
MPTTHTIQPKPACNRAVVEAFRRFEERSFTIFVDNLPQGVAVQDLWELFSDQGQVADVFVSRKRRTYAAHNFAFVRFAFRNHALRAIPNLNGWLYHGYAMKISEAKFKRGTQENKNMPSRGDHHQKETGRRLVVNGSGDGNDRNNIHKGSGVSYRDVVVGRENGDLSGERKADMENQGQEVTKEKPTLLGNISGEKDACMMEKLKFCLIGESVIPLIAEDVIPSLFKDWVELREVKRMGNYKMALFFDSGWL